MAAKICEVPDYPLKMKKLVKNVFEEKNDKFSHIHRLSTRDTDEQH
jgi:hypothetical protein